MEINVPIEIICIIVEYSYYDESVKLLRSLGYIRNSYKYLDILMKTKYEIENEMVNMYDIFSYIVVYDGSIFYHEKYIKYNRDVFYEMCMSYYNNLDALKISIIIKSIYKMLSSINISCNHICVDSSGYMYIKKDKKYCDIKRIYMDSGEIFVVGGSKHIFVFYGDKIDLKITGDYYRRRAMEIENSGKYKFYSLKMDITFK